MTKRDEESIKGIKINGFDEILRKSRNSNAISERIDNSNNNSSSLVKTNRTTISNKSNIRNYISVERRKINNHWYYYFANLTFKYNKSIYIYL